MIGVILAGGKNSRMKGFNKALLPFPGGELFIERQIRMMSQVCSELMIVTNHAEAFSQVIANDKSNMNITLVADQAVACGPIGGIHAALMHAKENTLWIVACDQPFISTAAAVIMEEILHHEKLNAVIPIIDGRHQMLHAVYDRNCLNPAAQLIEEGCFRLSSLLSDIDWKPLNEFFFQNLSIDLQFSQDIDTPEQYASMLHPHASEWRITITDGADHKSTAAKTPYPAN